MQNFNEIKKIQNSITKNRKLCPNCGHSVIFSRKDKAICQWCKNYVFKNKEVEFKYRLKEQLNKKNTN